MSDYEIDAATTVKRMESDLLTSLREKFKHYTDEILRLLNVELVIKGDSEIVEYHIPNSEYRVIFNSENEGYGLKIFDSRDFLFVSTSEMSLEDGKSQPLEEGMMAISEAQIRSSLDLMKNGLEALQAYVEQKKLEFRDKINLIAKY